MNTISFNSLNNAFRFKNMKFNKFNFDHVHYNHTLLSNNLVNLKKNSSHFKFYFIKN